MRKSTEMLERDLPQLRLVPSHAYYPCLIQTYTHQARYMVNWFSTHLYDYVIQKRCKTIKSFQLQLLLSLR